MSNSIIVSSLIKQASSLKEIAADNNEIRTAAIETLSALKVPMEKAASLVPDDKLLSNAEVIHLSSVFEKVAEYIDGLNTQIDSLSSQINDLNVKIEESSVVKQASLTEAQKHLLSLGLSEEDVKAMSDESIEKIANYTAAPEPMGHADGLSFGNQDPLLAFLMRD